MTIPINRGLDEDGVTRIGAIDQIASVDYQLMQDTAINGQDFRGQGGLTRGTLTFAVGQTVAYLSIEIIDETNPEVEESFKVCYGGI